MGLPSMTPQLGILDAFDRPEASMLVVVWGHPGHPRAQYVNPMRRPFLGRAYLQHFTPLQRFGKEAVFTEVGELLVRPGRWAADAVYPDGAPRAWQGRPEERVEIRSLVAGPILKAVRAMHRTGGE